MGLARRLRNAAVLWSLLLCVVTAAAWVVSYDARLYAGWAGPVGDDHRAGLEWTLVDVSRGDMRFDVARSPTFQYDYDDVLHPGLLAGTLGPPLKGRPRATGILGRLGFSLERESALERRDSQLTRVSLTLPCWSVILATALPPLSRAAAALRRRANRRHPAGFEVRPRPPTNGPGA